MFFTYSTVGLGFGIGKVAENRFIIKGNLAGILFAENRFIINGTLAGIGTGTLKYPGIEKLWRSLQALGAVAFAYSFSIILIEIQDTIKSPPAEYKTMKKAIWLSITVMTVLYLLCGCVGYAAYGEFAPLNLITGFGVYNPYWPVNIAYIATVVHLVGAYQIIQ